MSTKKLTKSEFAVCLEIIKGKKNREIADTLFVNEKTVKFHIWNIYKKLPVKSRYELIAQWDQLTDFYAELN